MDINADHTHVAIPRFDNFVIDPFSICGLGTDQYDGTGTPLDLIGNPFSDRRLSTPLYGFPVIVGSRPVALYRPDVPHLRCPPVIRHIMKTVESSVVARFESLSIFRKESTI